MTGLPDYQAQQQYSESDVEHIVARRLAAIQLEQLQNGQLELRKEMLTEIAEIKKSVASLVEAWNTAGNMVRLVKYVAGAVTAIAVIIGFLKSYGK